MGSTRKPIWAVQGNPLGPVPFSAGNPWHWGGKSQFGQHLFLIHLLGGALLGLLVVLLHCWARRRALGEGRKAPSAAGALRCSFPPSAEPREWFYNKRVIFLIIKSRFCIHSRGSDIPFSGAAPPRSPLPPPIPARLEAVPLWTVRGGGAGRARVAKEVRWGRGRALLRKCAGGGGRSHLSTSGAAGGGGRGAPW